MFHQSVSWCVSCFLCFQMANATVTSFGEQNLFPLNNSTSMVWQFWIPEGERNDRC